MKRLVPLLLLSAALLVAGCGGTSTATLGSSDAAIVGSQQITKDQFRELMDRAKVSYTTQKHPFPKPGSSEYEQLKSQAIAYLIQRAEYAQEADAMGIKVTDSQVDKRIQQIKKQYYGNSEASYEKKLKQEGLTTDQAKEEVRASV